MDQEERNVWRRMALAVITAIVVGVVAALGAGVAFATVPGDGPQTAPWIASDKEDYPPGAVVTLTGGNWQPGESVHIFVDDDQTKTWTRNVDVTADENGTITDTFNLPDWFVATYTVEATGSISGTAKTGFTDGNVEFRLATEGTSAPTSGPGVASFSWTVQYDRWTGSGHSPNTTCSGIRSGTGTVAMAGNTGINAGINHTESLRPTGSSAPSGHVFAYWSSSATSTTPLTEAERCTGGTNGGGVIRTLYAHFKPSKAAGSVTINNIPTAAVYGGSFTPTFTKSGSGTASAATKTAEVCSVSSGTVSFLKPGTCTLQASLTESSTHLAATGSDQSFTISKATSTVAITWADSTYNGSANSATASVSGIGDPAEDLGNATLTYYSGSAATGTPLGEAPTNAGTYAVKASFAGNDNYNSDEDTQTIRINKASQNITGIDVPTTAKTYGDSFTAAATGGASGNAITFSSAGACSNTGASFTMTSGTGTCTVKFNQAGNDNYEAATEATSTVTAAKATSTVAITWADSTYNGSANSATASVSGIGDPAEDLGNATLTYYSGSAATGTPLGEAPTNAGTYTVKASFAGNDNYNSDNDTQTIRINKATASVSIANIPGTTVYGGTFTPTYTKSGDGSTSTASSTPTTCSVAAGVVSFIQRGECTLVASLTEGTNHLAATGEDQSFTITRAPGSVSISNLPSGGIIGGTFTPTFTAAGDGQTSATSETPAICSVGTDGAVRYTAVGLCTLKGNVAEGANHLAATGTAQSFNVSYTWNAFLQPVNNTRKGQIQSRFKLGSTIPIKFQLFDASNLAVEQSGGALPVFAARRTGACDSSTALESEVASSVTSGNTFRWDAVAKQYIYNFSTKGLNGGEWTISAQLNDGSSASATETTICISK